MPVNWDRIFLILSFLVSLCSTSFKASAFSITTSDFSLTSSEFSSTIFFSSATFAFSSTTSAFSFSISAFSANTSGCLSSKATSNCSTLSNPLPCTSAVMFSVPTMKKINTVLVLSKKNKFYNIFLPGITSSCQGILAPVILPSFCRKIK